MSDVFERYERQYCELSANLSKKCTSATLLDGGEKKFLIQLLLICFDDSAYIRYLCIQNVHILLEFS